MLKDSLTALVTPMDKDGHIDEKALQNFLVWQIKEGTAGLVACGTTGEVATLSSGEQNRVLRICVELVEKKVPVFVGIGGNDTQKTMQNALQAAKYGADGVMAVVPYYNKPNQEGLYAHFKTLHEATELPILLYNVPGRTITDLAEETVARLARLPGVIGIKDATGDPSRLTRRRLLCGEDFVQLSGDDPTALAFHAHGGDGCISVTSNVAPRLSARFQALCRQGDFHEARRLHEKLMPLHQVLFASPSPGPAKYALHLMGKMDMTMRLPLTPPAPEIRIRIKQVLQDLDIDFDYEKAL